MGYLSASAFDLRGLSEGHPKPLRLLESLEGEQIIAENQAIVENILIRRAVRGMVGFLRVLNKDSRLKFWPVLFPDPG